MSRIFLSPPHVGAEERAFLLDALESNWIAPLGPHVDAFEREVAQTAGARHAVALSSGTAALHLALLLVNAGPGDEVLVPTLTFVSTAGAVRYVGATPVFIDSDWSSWNVDPVLVTAELERRAQSGRPPKAVIAVDLYGQCADYDRLGLACRRLGVPLIEDAAEALGATYRGRPAGSLGDIGIYSFNGNKIITTSGGGMLVTDNGELADRARYLASQAREPAVHYEHVEIGFNYRMSNLLAAVGRGQLRHLSDKVARRRAIFEYYKAHFEDVEGISLMPEARHGRSSRWLTVALIDPDAFGATRDDAIAALEADDIEARPAWKPMHRQPVFADHEHVGGSVADEIFERGLCLPSGSSMTDEELDRVVRAVRAVPRKRAPAFGVTSTGRRADAWP